MKGFEIRQAFLDYFASHGHRTVASAPLVPQGDATLMFVNAGMVPFKRVFTGEEKRDYSRATSSQKCMRVSGKHNDLEEVGRSPRHHTFFEMLGNFSFGDYFKREAIDYGWDLLTRVYGLDAGRLVVSVHEEDEEAESIWRDRIGLEPKRVFRLGNKENFWQMGDTGPCGPCSEIHLITDPERFESGADPSQEGYLELYNLVFMQFEQLPGGERRPLPRPSVDTGMGLERIACVLQGASSTYDTDLFQPILQAIGERTGHVYGSDAERDVSTRVVADHVRACAFLAGDGVRPSNDGRGYVMRRVLRRAARHGVLLGMERPFLFEVAGRVVEEMSGAYPELVDRRAAIQDTIRREEERFGRTLERGLGLLDHEIEAAREAGRERLPGEVVFQLYDTYGFPTDLTEDILRGSGLEYDRAAFDECMREQSERARAAWRGSGEAAPAEVYGGIGARAGSEFVGYAALAAKSAVAALVRDGAEVERAEEGDRVEVVVEATPFYAESGGQVGDSGVIEAPAGRVEVEDTQAPVEGLIVHQGRVAIGSLAVGEEVELRVDPELRAATVRNHSGTHLLHHALRRVLGPQVNQAGSLVGPDRLRFDITHDAPLSDEEIERIEDEVNALILANVSSEVDERPYAEALADGAIAMFSEKYSDRVRVVRMGPSLELCGGTHAASTGEIGSLRIVGQSALGAGVRRLEAQTGLGAVQHARRESARLREVSQLLRAAPAELSERVRKLLDRQRELDRELRKAREEPRRGGSGDLLSQARDVEGVRVVSAEVSQAEPRQLRGLVDQLKQRLGSGVVLLGARGDGKVALALGVTEDLTQRFDAGSLIRRISGRVGGSGGGRPDFAQAGGTQVDRLPEALESLEELLRGE
ncbi:MAG: alanine--tRNA ligase [Proteobacteria bacterium]|nr:alanine--tRNA ligase [Pseudomonadota bacterium]